ncbi:RNA-directed DNA polymerase [Candidatus Kaiserbacteria bacterium]|nr:RNA-directed DNA polymerase [Candidatus Kaiserbacteria bacterium]
MSFGLPQGIIDFFDVDKAIARIKNDLQSDFIYAPHLNAIYALAKTELQAGLFGKLATGTFDPSLPVTIEVPKASGLGRPGSILLPYERLIYQLVVDDIAVTADLNLDRTSVFSNKLLTADPNGFMFEPTGDCYAEYKTAIARHAQNPRFSHVIQTDIVSHFQNLNQHNLINLLTSAGCNADEAKFLERMLSQLAEKSSRGIIQGVMPSDFLGNFSLCSIDGQLAVNGLTFARYVDDISIFLNGEQECRSVKLKLSHWLRKEGLDLSEAKTKVLPVAAFLQEETRVEQMFDEAKDELSGSFDRNDFYRSAISWDFPQDDDEEADDQEVILLATRNLFDMNVDVSVKDKIDKFCIPTFIASFDDYAINALLTRFISRPHLAQLYAKYFRRMITVGHLNAARLEPLLADQTIISEYQYMWLYAALMVVEPGRVGRPSIAFALQQYRNANISPSLRAVSAIFVAKYGTPVEKRLIKDSYAQEQSDYVRAAILYSARYFTAAERATCYRAWGGHSELNSLVVSASRNTPAA